ncbi:DUF6850 family outer membrane beta-barrel protein [Geofilum sp. OHC36d9]|uniref:DUF6850 family outer membrane beta-barrel protein n=1 Tax=Geofilum sp. OHC36d9 TaxID=3458413 RepID=UPI0040347077
MILIFVCQAEMQGADTLSVIGRSHLWHSDAHLSIRLAENQPALKYFFPLEKYTAIATNTTYQNNQSLHYHYQGDKHTNFTSRAIGYHKNKNTAIFGEAVYVNGNIKNITWSQVDDQQRIGPYIIADSTTGNKQYETYLLSGGLSHQTNFGIYGLSAHYRAQSSYRTKDPRSYSVISDFKMTAAWASPIGPSHLAAISATYGRYDQQLSIKSYEENRTDLFYFMYGYGYFNQNLSGTSSNYSADYKGNNYTLQLQLQPLKEKGWFLKIPYTKETINARYSQRTRGSFTTRNTNIIGGHQWKPANHQYRITLNANHIVGTGTEYYYETIIVDSLTATKETRLLSKNQKFKQQNSSITLLVKGWFTHQNLILIPGLKTGLLATASEYKTTAWQESVNQWIIHPSFEIQRLQSQSFTGIKIAGGWLRNISNELLVDKNNLIVQNTLIPDFNYRSDNKIFATIEVKRIQNTQKDVAWQIKTNCEFIKTTGSPAVSLGISLGLILK